MGGESATAVITLYFAVISAEPLLLLLAALLAILKIYH